MNKQQLEMEMDFIAGDLVFADLDVRYGFSDFETFKVTKALILEDGIHVYEVEKNGQIYEVYPTSMAKVSDEQIEKLWLELEDVTMLENESGDLVLASDWIHFKAGITQVKIWAWFDTVHTKGISYLANEFKYYA